MRSRKKSQILEYLNILLNDFFFLGILAYFEELPDLSHTTIRVAEDQYDAREGSISQHATDAPNVLVYKRGDLSGNERGVFYFKRLRPLAVCYELEKWVGGNRTKFPVTGGWGIIGEGHDCRTDIFGALLLQIFPEIALYYLDVMSRFENITTNYRQLLAKMEPDRVVGYQPLRQSGCDYLGKNPRQKRAHRAREPGLDPGTPYAEDLFQDKTG